MWSFKRERAVSLPLSLASRVPFGLGRSVYHLGGFLSTPVALGSSVVAVCGDAAECDFLACFGPLALRSSCSADSAGRFLLSDREVALLVLERRLVGGGSAALKKLPLFWGTSPGVTRLGEGPGLGALRAGNLDAAYSECFLLCYL